MKRLLRWLLRSDLLAAHQAGYDECRHAYFSGYIPLLNTGGNRWLGPTEVIGYVKPGYEWIAEKASRQNVADYAGTKE